MVKGLLHALILFILILAAVSCSSSRYAFSLTRKFAPDALRKDYKLLREIIEKFHPSAYWYTPQDSMDLIFDKYYNAITDSMTRQQFGFTILAPVTTALHCGHTSFNFPPRYTRQLRDYIAPSFPLYMKIWPDTMVVTFNLNKKDSILKRGTVINSINGLDAAQLSDTLFKFMPADGYSENVNYSRLSAAFPYYHRNILGLSKVYDVVYTDSTGIQKADTVSLFNPAMADSSDKALMRSRNRQTEPGKKVPKWEAFRSFRLDTAHQLAIMTVNSFSSKGNLPAFFKQSFTYLRKNKIPNLVIDLRNNGGGKVNNFTALAKYVRNTPFKVCDTAVANTHGLGHYKKYFHSGFFNSLVLFFVTSKHADDSKYHFRYWERHMFQPRKRNHFNGKVFVLIGGPTFSASTLFAHTVKGQPNVTLVGEEAGGGWHGNNGLLIPDVILPNTRMRVRMPLFRLIQYNHIPKDGRGVMPDLFVPPTIENVRKGIDGKMKKVTGLIMNSSSE